MKLPKDFYEDINLIWYQGDLRSIEISLEDGVTTATGEDSPAMSIIKINGHKPLVSCHVSDRVSGRVSGLAVFIESLLLLPLPVGSSDLIELKYAEALIGRDVLCQYKFKLSLIDRMYEMCFDSKRGGALVKDAAVAVDNETKGSCGWNLVVDGDDHPQRFAEWFEEANFE